MPARFQHQAALGLLLLALTGCVSARTGQRLDRSYDQATARLSESTAKGQPAPQADFDVREPLQEEAVVAAVIARSPGLVALAHRARALVHAGRAEGALPPGELALEVWNLPLERPYSLGEADMYMVELRQRFPAAGSLDARARALAEEAQVVLFELDTAERLVAERASVAFADYAQAVAERDLQQQQLALLARLGDVVRARFSTGGSGLADAARLEVEVSKTRRALARSIGELGRAKATLNALLQRPAAAALPEPTRAAPMTVSLTLEELLAKTEQERGDVSSADARIHAADARRSAAVAEARVPEFMAGLGYWQDPSMRPGFGVTTSMSLPWLWGPGRQRVAQTDEELAAEQAARSESWLLAKTEVSEAHAGLVAIEQELRVTTREGLPAARRSLDALSATLATGSTSLLEWVDVARSLLDLEIEVALLEADLTRSIASLERAVGTPLPRAPLALEAAP